MKSLSLKTALLALCVVTGPVMADDLVRDCATGPETDRKLESLQRWVKAKELERSRIERAPQSIQPTSTLSNGMFVVEANHSSAPFLKSNALAHSSVRFTRTSDAGFRVQRTALSQEPIPETPWWNFSRSTEGQRWDVFTYDLKNFEFPFFDRTVTQLSITPFNAIYLDEAPRTPYYQNGPLETIAGGRAVISPLLLTEQSPVLLPSVYVTETADALTITWKTPSNTTYFRYTVQATLFRNGDILFSYPTLMRISWGSVIVTSGREPWRSDLRRIGNASDDADDVDPRVPTALKPMLDLQSVELSRVGSSNLLELRLELAGEIDRAAILETSALQYYVDFSNPRGTFSQYLLMTVDRDPELDSYCISGWGCVRSSPASRIEGRTITLKLLQDHLALPQPATPILAGASHRQIEFFADSLNGSATIVHPQTSIETNLVALSAPSEIDGPILDSFTLPVFNPAGVWDQMKTDFNLTNDQVDGVAIYQTFMTDIVFYAGAYSTVGNPQVDGIGERNNYGTRSPRAPALLHMHSIDYGWNSSETGSTSVSLHEFGHRWLYHLRIMEDGQKKRSLNPSTAHPAEFVHTPAPFNVVSDADASTMGGARWIDHGNGRFTSDLQLGYFSYSWTDLYLMGLASPAEVEPWFYIAEANPSLRNEYTPQPGKEVTGVRRDVNISQVIQALGPRVPSHFDAQRVFTVYFVIVTEPGNPPTISQLAKLDQHRRLFEQNFARATGGRAEVRTLFSPAVPRRRGARR